MQLVPAQLHLAAPPVSLPSARLRHAPVVAAISIRGVERDDVAALADLTTDALFGEASVLADGPIIYLQRQQIRQQQQRKLERRLGFEGESECKFFVAEDSDSIVGCLDLAVHLFDNSALRFELEVDTMPEDGGDYRWSPYVASLSVSKAYRRSGVGRRLVQEAEGWARQSSYSEVMLEVSQQNEGAICFYKCAGYSVVSKFEKGEAGGGAEEVTRRGLWWEIKPTGKFVMRKTLGFFNR